MGASVHTIKPKFINKFSPPGGCLLLKETVITERRGGVGARHKPTPASAATKRRNIAASVRIWRTCSCESCKLNQSWFLPPAAVNRPEFRRPAGGAPFPPLPPHVPSFPPFHGSAPLLCPLFSTVASLQPPLKPSTLLHSQSQFQLYPSERRKDSPGNSLTLIYHESARNHFQIICLRITLFFFCKMLFDSSPESFNLLQQSLACMLFVRWKVIWQWVLPPRADISSSEYGLAAAVGGHIGLPLPSIHIGFQFASPHYESDKLIHEPDVFCRYMTQLKCRFSSSKNILRWCLDGDYDHCRLDHRWNI